MAALVASGLERGGSLRETAFPGLLVDALSNSWTGRLDLHQDGQRRSVWFRSGIPLVVRSTLVDDHLGQMEAGNDQIGKQGYWGEHTPYFSVVSSEREWARRIGTSCR